MGLAWDAVLGGGDVQTVYEVLQAGAADYCAPLSSYFVVATTRATSYTVAGLSGERVFAFFVRVQNCSVGTPFAYLVDTMSGPAGRP